MTDPDLFPSDPVSHLSLFTQARELLGAALANAAATVLPAIAAELDAAAERASDERDRQALLHAAARLRRETASRVARLTEVFERRVLRCERFARAQEAGEAPALALVDDDELEQQIAAAELANAARERSGATYPVYVDRLRALSDLPWTDDDERNPLGARTLAAAAVAAVEGGCDTVTTRERLRRLAIQRFAEPIAAAIAAADRMLADAGIAPLPPDTTPQPPEAAARPGVATRRAAQPPSSEPAASLPMASITGAPAAPRSAPEAAEPGSPAGTPLPSSPMATESNPHEAAGAGLAAAGEAASDDEQPPGSRALEVVARADQDAVILGSSALATLRGGSQLRVLPTLQPSSDIEQDAVAFAHTIGALPYSRQARAEFFGNVRTRLRDSNAMPAQVAVVDVVAALFDYVIDDRRLPEAAKPLVWRLQQPAVALSLLDPAYLGDDPRSLRRLVENFGAIATAFADDLTRGSELHRRLETVVRAVEIVSSALQTRSAVMALQVEKEYSRAARSVGQLIERVVRERRSLEETPGRRNRRDYSRRPSREREKAVTEHLRTLLAERLDRHSAPESVREFVLNVWLRHMRTAALRNGEESAEFKVTLQVVDDLLWSLNGSAERRSRRELAKRIPPLIRLMTQGVREIGAKDEEFKSFFDELFLIHLRRMQRRERGTARESGDDTMAADAGAAVPVLNHRVAGSTDPGATLETAQHEASRAGDGQTWPPKEAPALAPAAAPDPVAAPAPAAAPPLTPAPMSKPIPTAAQADAAEAARVASEAAKAVDEAAKPASEAAKLADEAAKPADEASKTAGEAEAAGIAEAAEPAGTADAGARADSGANADAAGSSAWTPPPSDAPPPTPAAGDSLEADGTERRLLEILNSLDLTDLPDP
ncbi:MAG: DUF1631 family protein, partial [Burkholderiaceae bacterium]